MWRKLKKNTVKQCRIKSKWGGIFSGCRIKTALFSLQNGILLFQKHMPAKEYYYDVIGTSLEIWIRHSLYFSQDNEWQLNVSRPTICSNRFPPPPFLYITLFSGKQMFQGFPEICFLDRHLPVVLNVTLSKRAREKRLWMMLNVLWLPAFVSLFPCAARRLW